jgi:hypothetical protein
MRHRSLESTIRAMAEGREEPVLTTKLDRLLRFGLASKSELVRMRRALQDRRKTATVPMYREMLIRILERLLDIIEKDPMIFARVFQKVTKERPGDHFKEEFTSQEELFIESILFEEDKKDEH